MILVDTSVWIDYFRPFPARPGFELRRLIEEAEPFVLTGIVVFEILQGLKRDAGRVERFLSQWEFVEPSGFVTYREAAAISRSARSQGITLSTIDALISAIAIENDASLFTTDKDFSEVTRVSPLRLYSFLTT